MMMHSTNNRGNRGRPRRPRPSLDENRRPPHHINAFLNLNGIPYLVGEYLDRNQMRQMDRGHIIGTRVNVDSTSEAMRSIVDVHVNDIPQVPVGNRSGFKHLIRATRQNARRLEHQFDVLQRGIVAQVNYRLENRRTGHTIRSMSESLQIRDRNFFVDINPRNINDNAILVNFSQSIGSTINQFTHGTDRMTLRIVDIQLFYPMIERHPIRRPSSSSHIGPQRFHGTLPHMEGNDVDVARHHKQWQPQHIAGNCNCDSFSGADAMFVNPPNWMMFNRLYRFDNWGKDIILHFSEIHDPTNRMRMIPCGTIRVNRAFVINPGHRIVFRFNIWKNDLVVVNNTQQVAKALGVQNVGQPGRPPWWVPGPPSHRPPHRPPHGRPRPPWLPPGATLEDVLAMLMRTKAVDRKQSREIAELRRLIEELMNGGGEPPCPPDPGPCCPEYPDCCCGPCCDDYPNCNCDKCCDDYPDCDCPCCDEYPDCDCCDNGPPEPPPGPCCPEYPDCDCCDPCHPGDGDCDCEAMTQDDIERILEYVWGP